MSMRYFAWLQSCVLSHCFPDLSPKPWKKRRDSLDRSAFQEERLCLRSYCDSYKLPLKHTIQMLRNQFCECLQMSSVSNGSRTADVFLFCSFDLSMASVFLHLLSLPLVPCPQAWR
eukprot:2338074-Amphidinium_carterae.1